MIKLRISLYQDDPFGPPLNEDIFLNVPDSVAREAFTPLDFPDEETLSGLFTSSNTEIQRTLMLRAELADWVAKQTGRAFKEFIEKRDTKMGYPK